ncbi:DNA-cytosine methyltransferase [Pedosphaera parvula Ellin514]|uniref:DNA (cytosine-5-)-methyltransferase n=2 Tax=Pedosphaera TaxID=1032526 RepID=B9XNU5_PEDPL|nr:DNA-cytosine methyltransferase [Pedosphaera parvula Ellin514]
MKAGWKGVIAIEKDPMAFATLKHNLVDMEEHFAWPKWLPTTSHDIKKVIRKYPSELKKLAGKITLVAGGPPCQGFSVNGKRQEKDQRNRLVKSYVAFVKIVKPKLLLFENVRGFTMEFAKNGSGEIYSDKVCKLLRKLGYDVFADVIDFAGYGVPQRRRRYILVGTLKGSAKAFFKLIKKQKVGFLKRKGLPTRCTVSQAIRDLQKCNGLIKSPDSKSFLAGTYSTPQSRYQRFLREGVISEVPDSHRFAKHEKSTVRRFRDILRRAPKAKQISEELKAKYKLKKRSITPLCANSVSPTLTSLPDDYIHYSEPRILTVREYARLQSFPDRFEFKGKYTTGGKLRRLEVPRYTQIGNAIPPLFAEQAGLALRKLL